MSEPSRVNVINWIIGLQEDHGNLLEISCNEGHYIKALRDRGYDREYTGIDITPSYLETARKRLPKENFQWGDARNLDFPSDAFDLVTAVGILMHLPQLEKPMRELFRVARKYVIISVYGGDGPTVFRRNTDEGEHGVDFSFNKQDILAQIPQGWELVEFKEFKRPHKPEHYSRFHQYLVRRAMYDSS